MTGALLLTHALVDKSTKLTLCSAPLRLFIFLLLVLYTFLFSSSSPMYYSGSSRRDAGPFSHPSAHAHNPNYVAATWGGEGLKNRVFFAFIFVELVSWFWVWVTLKEEKPDLVRRSLKDRARDQAHLD